MNDGGTPLVVALFWGREMADTPRAGEHRGFYRPHGGFPAWRPSDDPQEVLDEALVWAAKSDHAEALRLLVELGAYVDDPYRGTALTWAAVNGRVDAVRTLVERGADPNHHRGTFGRPSHGEGVTAIHLAVKAGQREAVVALLGLGADALILDNLHGGNTLGWARVGGHPELADILA